MGRKRRRRCTTTTAGISSGDLPAELLDVILARLPLREAARASVLSVAWGHSWRQLSDLDFTTSACDREAIDAVIRHRSGPVRRVRLVVTDAHLLPGVQVQGCSWTAASLLSQLLEAGLQSLDLDFSTSGPPPPPPPVFAPGACTHALKELVLTRCVLPTPLVTAVTGGFPSLARLRLRSVSVHEGSDLEAMVSFMCPKLEELTLVNTGVLGDEDDDKTLLWRYGLRMASPSLGFLEINCQANIHWGAACLPRVEHARLLDTSPDSVANILRGMASSVQKLVYYNSYVKIEPPKGLPSSYANLDSLEIEVYFSYAPQITSMIYFLKTAPNLTQLVVNDLITDESSEQTPYHWPPLGSYEICPKLRFLRMVAISPLRNALDFVRFVLSAARMLQILEVGTTRTTRNKQQIAQEICKYDRVSLGVQIYFTIAYSM